MTSADDSLVVALFQMLAAAQVGETVCAHLDASNPEGISAITLVAMPTQVWQQLDIDARRIGGG